MSKEYSEKVSTTVAEKVIAALVLIAVGVLFCFNVAAKAVNVTIGVALCLYGAINVVLAIAKKKSLFSAEGVLSGVVIALGVFCIVENLLSYFVSVIPYILIAVGAVFVLDACIAEFSRKDVGFPRFLFELVMGAACLVLGLCLLFVASFRSSASLIFGSGLIVFGAYRLVELIAKKKL